MEETSMHHHENFRCHGCIAAECVQAFVVVIWVISLKNVSNSSYKILRFLFYFSLFVFGDKCFEETHKMTYNFTLT
jgi:hypothetical protein